MTQDFMQYNFRAQVPKYSWHCTIHVYTTTQYNNWCVRYIKQTAQKLDACYE